MQNQFSDQKKARKQNTTPQDCKHPQNKGQEQEQSRDQTGGPNRH